MALTNAKHIIAEIDGVRCTIVESGVTRERASFLKDLLEFNKLDVKELQEQPSSGSTEPLYTVGVTDLVFNPVFAVYECLLKTKEGGYVTPGYWRQECVKCDTRYWIKRKVVRKSPREPNEVLQS